MKIEKLHKNNSEGLVDMESAAKYLSIKKSSLYQLCMRKKIPVVKIGNLNRFRKSDLDDFISQNVVEAEKLL